MATAVAEAPPSSARGPAAAAGAAVPAVAPERTPAARSFDQQAAPARRWPPPRSGQDLGRPAGRRVALHTISMATAGGVVSPSNPYTGQGLQLLQRLSIPVADLAVPFNQSHFFVDLVAFLVAAIVSFPVLARRAIKWN